jgi:hypothetical protein
MRLTALILALAIVGAWAGAAGAVREGEIGFAPLVGMMGFTGKPGEFAAPDLAYGLAVSGGLLDWFGLEVVGLYTQQEQKDTDETGEVKFTDLMVGFGPRFNWTTHYFELYASLAGGASFLKYTAKWGTSANLHEDNNNAHAFGGLGMAGADFFIYDTFAVGLAGSGGLWTSNLEFSNKTGRSQQASFFADWAGLLRLQAIF